MITNGSIHSSGIMSATESRLSAIAATIASVSLWVMPRACFTSAGESRSRYDMWGRISSRRAGSVITIVE
ncbi:MAG: hypothetical protein ACE5GB_04300 [Acidimicrobiales bacterium]